MEDKKSDERNILLEKSRIQKLKNKTTLMKWPDRESEIIKCFNVDIIKKLNENDFGGIIKEGHPRGANLDGIESIGETAYQRAIWHSKSTKFSQSIIEWVDVEVPVVHGGAPRRPCVDLIGLGDHGERVLVELKDGGFTGKAQAPLYTMHQLFRYALCMDKNKASLRFHDDDAVEKRCKDAGINSLMTFFDLNRTLLIVAAPEPYWNYYLTYKGLNRDRMLKNLIEVKNRIELPIKFAIFPLEYFSQQRNNLESYKPKLMEGSNKEWAEIK